MFYATAFADSVSRGPKVVELEDLSSFMADHPDWSPGTRQAVVATLRSLFGWIQRSGRRKDNPALLLPTVRVPARQPRPCPESALAAALAGADERVRLMVEAAAFCGLRRHEIAQLHSDQLTRTLIGAAVEIKGKGGRVRIVPISDTLADAIAARPGWTFPGRTDGHLSAQSVGKLVGQALPGKWTTHTLRHRFASAAYAGDNDLRAVQELLGHASVATTQIYTLVPDEARRRAATAAWTVAA